MMAMKILIDGCVFAQPGQTGAIQWWKQLMPKLVARLEDKQVLFLNRTSSAAFPELVSLKNLFAPPVDFECSALEDRRLAALCRELEVDVFISTYNTSAGTEVKTLFVFHQMDSGFSSASEQEERAILSSRNRALRMSSGYLVLSPHLPENSVAVMGMQPEDCTWKGEPGGFLDSQGMLDWEKAADQFAAALHELGGYTPPAEVALQRTREEEATRAEAMRLKRIAEEQAIAVYAAHASVPQDQARKGWYRRYLFRAYQALQRPDKYPEYLARIYQSIRQKIKL